MSTPATDRRAAIIGSGLIGRSWAIIFASAGYSVKLFDSNADCLAQAIEMIRADLTELCAKNLARGHLTLEQQMALISTSSSLADCLTGATHIQECVFDSVPLKQDIFEQVDELLGADNLRASICSSTSIHLPSRVFAKVKLHKNQCLVAHPVNPPHHVRLVELVPCAETSEEIIIQTRLTMDEVGQRPVVLNKEISGFALNRLQYAVFQVAFRLVHDGVMTPDDVDTVVSDGLGPRYAFMGPWMTAHLNAAGMADYLERYADGIYNVLKDCEPVMRLEGEAAQKIVDTMTHEVPIDKLNEKRAWRDKCLIELAKVKDKLGSNY